MYLLNKNIFDASNPKLTRGKIFSIKNKNDTKEIDEDFIINQELTQAMYQNRFVAHIWLPFLQK
ncbi:MAG: hypothetical protein RMX35_28770 [Nostoc sp. DcaGUA01]|uniref:hypothetical protein n=1 Tax=Nostoc sp. CCY 9925 TaxID=3103865 RepID=UPI002AD9CEEA|nr:hypothetical protein [Nostoc sp. DcaGUA01]